MAVNAPGGVCRNQKLNASLGEYVIKVTSADSNVTLHGFHGINGKRQSTWEHADLFNSSQKFTIQATERHQTIVVATFTGGAGATSQVTVSIERDGTSVMDACVLKPGARTSSSMSILAPLV